MVPEKTSAGPWFGPSSTETSADSVLHILLKKPRNNCAYQPNKALDAKKNCYNHNNVALILLPAADRMLGKLVKWSGQSFDRRSRGVYELALRADY
jgi:hypothetical protein